MQDSPKTRPSLLLRLRNQQDAEAWGEFSEIYEPLVYRLARKIGLQDADARELTQDVLLAVSGAIDRWNPDSSLGSFRGWLHRVARNLMVNLLIKQRRHPRGVGNTEFQRLLAEQPAPESLESATFDREFRRRAFRWAADRIQNEFHVSTWQAFWRTCVEERSVKDVSKELAISVGAVYVARSRVMSRLRDKVLEITDPQMKSFGEVP